MTGNAALDAQQLECHSSLARTHRVVIADRENREVRLVDAADQLHVPERIRVPGEVELEAVLELDHETRSLAQERSVVRARRVARGRDGDLDPVELDRTALVRIVAHAALHSLTPKPAPQLG